jgi:hypothetical protein
MLLLNLANTFHDFVKNHTDLLNLAWLIYYGRHLGFLFLMWYLLVPWCVVFLIFRLLWLLSDLFILFDRVCLIIACSRTGNSWMDIFWFKLILVLILNLPLVLLFWGEFCFFALNFNHGLLTNYFSGWTFADTALFLLVSLLMGRLRLLNLTCFTFFILWVIFALFLCLIVGVTRISLVFVWVIWFACQ